MRVVQKALERLPHYGVFDFLAFGVDRGTVTLFGGGPSRFTIRNRPVFGWTS